MRLLRKLLKIAAGFFVLFIIGIAGILASLRIEHGSAVTLPDLTGPFPVARAMFDWTDESRIDTLAPTASQKRELTVWIWYPAAPKPQQPAAEYEPGPWQSALANYQGALMTNFFTRDVSKVRAHSSADAEVSPVQPTYPVVIMKPGIGANDFDYTALAEDLASHGFVVVGSDSPYSTSVVVFPDGRVVIRNRSGNPFEDISQEEADHVATGLIKIWAADDSFVLDHLAQLNSDPSGRFRGRLDLSSVGVFGHSFGGATSVQVCHDDQRFKAGIDVDGNPFGTVVQAGLDRPFLFLLSDYGNVSDAEGRKILGKINAICSQDKGGCRIASIRGARHFNFSDQALLKARYLGRFAGMLGPIGERRGLRIAAAAVDAFFEVHLRHAPTSLINDLPQKYGDLRFGPP